MLKEFALGTLMDFLLRDGTELGVLRVKANGAEKDLRLHDHQGSCLPPGWGRCSSRWKAHGLVRSHNG
jgi:hypothetical protein